MIYIFPPWDSTMYIAHVTLHLGIYPNPNTFLSGSGRSKLKHALNDCVLISVHVVEG